MNEDELNGTADGTGADGMFADLGHFTTGAIPVDAVLKQGKAIRTRRRVVGGGVLAVAAALTVGVPVALAGGGPEAAPTSGHAIAVQRPSPESDTRPAKSSRSGDSCSAAAVRSRSHDSTTLPRRHTSLIAGMSNE